MTRTVAKVEVKKHLEQELANGKEISKELTDRAESAAGDSGQSYEEEEEEEEEDTVDEAPSIVDEISAKGHKKLSIQGAAIFGHAFK